MVIYNGRRITKLAGEKLLNDGTIQSTFLPGLHLKFQSSQTFYN